MDLRNPLNAELFHIAAWAEAIKEPLPYLFTSEHLVTNVEAILEALD